MEPARSARSLIYRSSRVDVEHNKSEKVSPLRAVAHSDSSSCVVVSFCTHTLTPFFLFFYSSSSSRSPVACTKRLWVCCALCCCCATLRAESSRRASSGEACGTHGPWIWLFFYLRTECLRSYNRHKGTVYMHKRTTGKCTVSKGRVIIGKSNRACFSIGPQNHLEISLYWSRRRRRDRTEEEKVEAFLIPFLFFFPAF